jgi:hypothetical protein
MPNLIGAITILIGASSLGAMLTQLVRETKFQVQSSQARTLPITATNPVAELPIATPISLGKRTSSGQPVVRTIPMVVVGQLGVSQSTRQEIAHAFIRARSWIQACTPTTQMKIQQDA